MDNQGYKRESRDNGPYPPPAYPDLSNGHPSPSPDLWKEGRPVPTPPKKKPGPVKSTYKKTKYALKSNPYTNPFFPPNGEVATTLTLILTIVAIFFTARTVLGPIADVGGTIFALLMLILLALIGGKLILGATWLLQKFCKVDIRLPPLLGMLIVGIILKNVPYNFGQFGRAECTVDSHGVHHNASGQFLDSIHGDTDDHKGSFRRRRDVSEDHFDIDEFVDDVLVRVERSVSIGGDSHETKHEEDEDDCHPKYIGHDLDPTISRTLRSICLAVILLMAGLELDPVALMKLSAMVIRATFIPCFTEALVVAVLSNLILGLPWTVGFMLGFVLAAVSPAVIIPSLMSLSQRGYGVAKGIPTLVIAACSADDVVAISGFGIFFGLTFSAGAPLWKLILHGPIEVAIGVGFGVFWGILAQWIPNKEHHHVVFFRWLILLGGGLIAIFGAQLFHYDGAGGLATIILAFVAGMEWRKEGWGDHNPVMKTFKRMWIILEPIIFALIGTEIQVDKIDFQVLGYSILVLFGALVIRMIGTYFSVTCGTLNTKEKIFMAFAWLPKATVQAALGPIFLDSVLKLSDDHWKSITEDICKVWNNGTNYALNNGVSVASDFVGWVNSTDLSTWVNGTEIEPNCIYSIEGDWEATKMIWTDWGNNILTLAVLSILITAPLGAISILALGPKLLESNKDEDGVPHSSDEESSH